MNDNPEVIGAETALRWEGPVCERCDRPAATPAVREELAEGEDVGVCWGDHDCELHKVDWREEPLRLRAENARIIDQVAAAVGSTLAELPDEAAQLLAADAIEAVRRTTKRPTGGQRSLRGRCP
jgi:hypothetical protein